MRDRYIAHKKTGECCAGSVWCDEAMVARFGVDVERIDDVFNRNACSSGFDKFDQSANSALTLTLSRTRERGACALRKREASSSLASTLLRQAVEN